MRIKDLLLQGILAFLIIFLAQISAIYIFTKSNNVNRFNLSSEQIIKDLEGRAVGLMLNQVWPFDQTQNITIQVINKKQLDEYVVVIVEVKAVAPLQQEKEPSKEQYSTNPHSKDQPKTKVPTKLQLTGRMKLTYELIDNDWYLLSAENLTLRAMPLN